MVRMLGKKKAPSNDKDKEGDMGDSSENIVRIFSVFTHLITGSNSLNIFLFIPSANFDDKNTISSTRNKLSDA
jgi:hypothetical protein